MRQIYIKIVMVVIWLVCTGATGRMFIQSLQASNGDQASIAFLKEAKGDVAFRPQNSFIWNDAGVEQSFSDGDIVSTSNGSRARIHTHTGHVIELDPNTMVKLQRENSVSEENDRRYVLKLLKGSMVAKRTAGITGAKFAAKSVTTEEFGSLRISAGNKVIEVPIEPKSDVVVAQPSAGKNSDQNTRGQEIEELERLSAKKGQTMSIELPALAHQLVLPSMVFAPASVPKMAKPEKPVATVVKPAKIIRPVKLSVVLPEPVNVEEITAVPDLKEKERRYVFPIYKGGSQANLISFSPLSGGCDLGNYPFRYVIKTGDDVAEDWEPIAEMRVGSSDVVVDTFKLKKSPGVHTLLVPLGKMCSDSDEKRTRSIAMSTGYVRGDGILVRSPNKPAVIGVSSLYNVNKVTRLVFSAEAESRSSDQAWIRIEKGPSGIKDMIVVIPASTIKPGLIKHLPLSRLTKVSFSGKLENKPGVYLVRGATVVLGFNGTLPSNARVNSAARYFGADHGFVGTPDILENIKGAPMNKLSMLETIARKSGPITLVSRGNTFEMAPQDFENGSKELLLMASTVSAAYSKKPQKIFFPLAH